MEGEIEWRPPGWGTRRPNDRRKGIGERGVPSLGCRSYSGVDQRTSICLWHQQPLCTKASSPLMDQSLLPTKLEDASPVGKCENAVVPPTPHEIRTPKPLTTLLRLLVQV